MTVDEDRQKEQEKFLKWFRKHKSKVKKWVNWQKDLKEQKEKDDNK